MPVAIVANPDLSILTDRQRDAVNAVHRQLRALGRTSLPGERETVLPKLLVAGAELKRITTKVETQLTEYDNVLRERGATEAEDDLWIQNLRRLETMLAVLARAKEVV